MFHVWHGPPSCLCVQSYMADIGYILYVDIGYTLYVLHCLSEPYEKRKTFFKKERKGERAERGTDREIDSLAVVS